MSVTIRDNDRDFWRIEKELVKLGELSVRAGFNSGKNDDRNGDEDATNAEIAFYNEFGAGNIPPRPFVAPAADENKTALSTGVAHNVGQLLEGRQTAGKTAGRAGLFLKSKIQEKIVEVRTPPNALATQIAKGKKTGGGLVDNPLIDTGQMRQAVSYIVKRDRKK